MLYFLTNEISIQNWLLHFFSKQLIWGNHWDWQSSPSICDSALLSWHLVGIS